MGLSDFGRISSFTVNPAKSRAGHEAEIKDTGGGAIGATDSSGAVRDASGNVLFLAPVSYKTKRHGPLNVWMDIKTAQGDPLGTAQVVKYGLGPRSKTATLSLQSTTAEEIIRLEPADKKGERLRIFSGDTEYATIDVTEVKTGFMRKAKIYTVTRSGAAPEDLETFVLAAAIRYDAVIDALLSASMESSARD